MINQEKKKKTRRKVNKIKRNSNGRVQKIQKKGEVRTKIKFLNLHKNKIKQCK